MIILEGPDGGGKTTLLARITKAMGIKQGPRASSSVDGPVSDLCSWVDSDLRSWGQHGLMVYDRYPLISEPIYGPICRGKVPHLMTTSWMHSKTALMCSMSLVIWCLPHLETVKKNVQDTGEGQMSGVSENIEALWSSYAMTAQTWPGSHFIYDYQFHDHQAQETDLVDKLRTHYNTWMEMR